MNVNILHLKRATRTVLLFLLLGAVGTTNALALDFTEGNLTYTVNEGGTSVTVTGHANGTSATGALDIPQSVTHGAYTYAVTDIEEWAFYDCTGLTSVTIPSTMTSIGSYAFYGCSGLLILNYNAVNCSGDGFNNAWLAGCSSLVNLNIGENVQIIPDYFVAGRSSFVGTLTIPNSVTYIGYEAFSGCSGFASVVIGNAVITINNYAFHNCSGLASVSIPNSVTYIGSRAFYKCSGLASIDIPNSVTSMGNYVFYECTSLASVVIGNGVTSIDSYTFANCTSLTSVTLPNSLLSIGNNAFSSCGNLPSITIPDAVLSIGESAFSGCGLSSVSIGNSVASIGNSAFSGCGFTSVTIPNSVVSIGNSAFSWCSNLASVTLGTSVYSIGDAAFWGCSSLTSIEIPTSVASVGSGAFGDCIGLAQITVASGNPVLDSRDNCNAIVITAANKLIVGCKNTVIPNTVTIIGEQAFNGCTGLTSITFPDALITIESMAFENCSGLTSITLPASVTSIGSYAFYGCSGLITLNYNAVNCSGDGFNNAWLAGCSSLVNLNIGENVQIIPDYFIAGRSSFVGTLSIPNSVTSIGHEAFSGCSGFASVSIGNSVTSIGSYAFDGCSSLASVVIPNSVTSINYRTFYGCSNLASVTIPNFVTSIGQQAFYGCNSLASIDIPNSVVSIGNSAFYNCNSIASINIGNSLTYIGESAFYNCYNVAIITSHAETPPTLGNQAFLYVPNIPVYVPCEGLEAYTSANWGGFSNIMGMCAGEITVTANPAGGGTVSGGGSYEGGATCTLGATSYGYLPFLNWTKDGEVVSANPNYSFIVTGDASFVANFGQINGDEFQIGSGTATNDYLPSYSYYKYSLTQQIYTTGEMGGMPGVITSIAFFNAGSEKTRNYDIYMVNTEKTTFANNSDWIAVEAGDLVFSGDVTLPVGEWTTITFDTPFNYDGVNNLALIVDDNTGSWSQGLSCRVFDADGYQALYKYDDGTNYNPYNPSSISGTRLSVKNQIKLGIVSTTGTNIEFADEAVKALCVANWDTDGDGELSYVEAAAVTDLGMVFKNNTTITSFDELQCFTGLTSIGEWAFGHCSSLTSIVIPNTTTFIGNSAFSCSGLTSITIPYSVNNIHTWAFDVCSELEQIVVASDNAVYDSRDNCNAIIKTASNTLIVGCKTTIIPSTVTSIGNSAFYGRNSLTSINIPDSVTSIGGYAFYGCSGLTSIDIPHSVTSIGSYAFNGCSALTSMTIMADVPPTLSGNAVFGYVNKSIPVYVPCGFVESYQNAEGWDVFTNFIGMCPVEITATANPTNGGVLTGAGTYNAGEICTLTATTNEGYSFNNWTLASEVVSNSPTYTFAVTEAGDYVANFELNCYDITATAEPAEGGTVEGAGTYNYGTTATLTATTTEGYSFINWTKDGTVVSTEATFSFTVTEAGNYTAYFELNSYEITVEATPTEGGSVTGAGTYNHFETCTLTATPNTNEHYTFINWTKDGEEVATTSTYTFTVTEAGSYVANFELESFEVTATAMPEEGGTLSGTGTYTYGATATLTATPNTGYNIVSWTQDGEVIATDETYSFTVTEDAHFIVTFEYAPEQALASGWNWYSTYVEMEGNNGLEQLESSLGSNGLIIKSRNNGFVEYYEAGGQSGWFGTLGTLSNEQMYKVRTNAACTTAITGEPTSPADHPITIANGWNWIGFPSSQPVNVSTALTDFTSAANDVIKGRTGFTTYFTNESGGLWYGTLNSLEPGQGYMYQSNDTEAKTLTFLTGRGEAVEANITPDGNVFVPRGESFADNMTVTAIVELDGEEVRSEDYELAAFVGSECRGSVRLMYVAPIDRYIAFLTVLGESDETLSFQLTDGAETLLSVDELSFVADGMVGSLSQPFAVSFRGMTGIEDGTTARVRVYPNPSDGIFHIEGQGIRKVEIFNAIGQRVVSEETSAESFQIDLGSQAKGVYVLRVVTDGGVKVSQIIKQ